MDSCGPSNALQSLSKHSQADRSLQNDISNGIQNNLSNQQFRSNNFRSLDSGLSNDFNQFQNPQNLNQFTNLHQNMNINQNQHQHQNQNQNLMSNENNWANDFSNLSLNQVQHHDQINQQPVLSNNWNQQFMQQRLNPQSIQSNYNTQTPQINNFASGFLNMRTNLSSPMNLFSKNQLSEHQELHKFEKEQELFSKEFSEVENQLQYQTNVFQNQQVAEQLQSQRIYTSDREDFANAAKQVVSAMASDSNPAISEETNTKFANSNFLKLMSQISKKQVELNEQGDKLINTTDGEDIRNYLPDPLKDLKQDPSGSQPPRLFNDSHINRLGDPLAGIRSGELPETPLEAARMANSDVNMHDWEEHYDQ